MPTQLEITNLALYELGQSPIASLGETNRRAQSASAFWAYSRDACLRLHPWNFAIKRVTLAENLLTYSEEFDNAAWTSSSVSEAANSTYAPNGELTADTITDATAVTAGVLTQTATIPDDSQDYVFSIYLKKGTASEVAISLTLSGGSTADSDNASITWGTSPTVDNGTIESIGDGWYRLAISLANNATGHTGIIVGVHPAGLTAASTGTVYAWGAQLSRGTSAIGYAKTTSAVIRPMIPNYGYERGFAQPSDFIRLVDPEDETMPFKVEGANILTNESSINFEYVFQQTDVATWDSLFCELMKFKLAADIAMAVTNNMALKGQMMQMYSYTISEAQFADSKENEQPAEQSQSFTFLRARISGVPEL